METTKIVVTTEVTLPKDVGSWQVKELEAKILAASLEAGRRAYNEALVQYEKALILQHPEWDRKEKPVKKLATRLGELRYERYRVWDRDLKISRYPLDEALGLKKQSRASVGYQGRLMEQAVQRSYRQTAKELEGQTGVEKSAMSQWRLLQGIAIEKRAEHSKLEKVIDWRKNLLPDPPKTSEPDPCPVLGIDLDDTYCRSWKTRKWLKDHQVRVAVLYRCKERVSKRRWRLKDKTVVTSGPGESLSNFYNRVVQTAITHYGLHTSTFVVVHGDGDPQNRNFAQLYFGKALYRLDPWHVRKRIREACGIQKIPDTWDQDIYGKPDSLIAKIKTFHALLHKRDPKKEKVAELIQYLQNNREGLLPSNVSTETKQKYPRLFLRGSGTIERNVAWTINDRFKLPRMSWSQNGLENLLFLREKYLNAEVTQKYQPKIGSKPDIFCLMH